MWCVRGQHTKHSIKTGISVVSMGRKRGVFTSFSIVGGKEVGGRRPPRRTEEGTIVRYKVPRGGGTAKREDVKKKSSIATRLRGRREGFDLTDRSEGLGGIRCLPRRRKRRAGTKSKKKKGVQAENGKKD